MHEHQMEDLYIHVLFHFELILLLVYYYTHVCRKIINVFYKVISKPILNHFETGSRLIIIMPFLLHFILQNYIVIKNLLYLVYMGLG